tara:strand:- start:13333 stop:15645 length:2313 start_codon:yes stop_codon:yes gene_type:complete
MWAALGKAAVGAVKGGAKKIATDKLLNRKKKTDARREKAQEVMGVGPEKGGAMVKAPSSALANVPLADSVAAISKSSSGGGGGSDDSVVGVALKIKTTVIQVEKLLSGSVALQKKVLQTQKDAQEDAEFGKEEADLEKKVPKKAKSKFKIPIPGKGMLASLIGFVSNVALGFLAVKLFEWMPKLMWLVKTLQVVVDVIGNIAVWVLDIFSTIVDWGYKLVSGLEGMVKNVFGEEGAKKFETFMTNLKDLIQGFLIWKILGEKIFKAVLKSVTRAFRIARVIIKRSLRFAKKFLANIGKQILRIPGVSNVVGKVAQVGGNLLSKGSSLLSKGTGILSKGGGAVAGKVAAKVGGFAAKIFGPAVKIIAPAMKAAAPAIKGFAGRIPILGPIVVALVSLISGEPIGQALFKGIGAAIGGGLGATLAAGITTATVGIGALLAPAMVMLGELLGAFVGDLLYELFLGGGWKAALDKLKGAITGIFDAIKNVVGAVFNFFKDGFGRLIDNFPTIPIPDLRPGDLIANIMMKIPGGLDILGLEVPSWVPGIGGASVIGALQGLPGLQEVLGYIAQFIPGLSGYVENGRLGRIPNLLMLTPYGFPFLVPTIAKSFMPGIFGQPTPPSPAAPATPVPEKISAASIRAESDRRKKEARDKVIAEVKGKFDSAKDAVGGFVNKINPFKRNNKSEVKVESGTEIKENPPNLNLANNQSNSRSDTIDSVSDFATYEGSDEGDEILLAPSPSGGGTTQSGNQVVEKIVKVPVDTSDPYEVLYKG